MKLETKPKMNVKQAIPFFGVSNIESSVRYYVEGLGFEMTKQWIHGVTLVLELKRPLRLRRPSKLITKTSFRYQFGAENGFSGLQTGPMKPNNSYRKELRLEFVVSVSRATPI